MASWLLGVSKLKTDHIEDTKSSSDVPKIDSEPTKNTVTIPQMPYDLQPAKPKTFDDNEKPVSMLDSIPFVLSNQFNDNTNALISNLEDTRKLLLTVKSNLDSGFYNYDFSNDRKVVSDIAMYVPN